MRSSDMPWLHEEDEFLRANYASCGVAKIARLMPRHDAVSIAKRARKLGLTDGRGRHAKFRVINGGKK